MASVFGYSANAAEYIRQTNPSPGNAQSLDTSLDHAFSGKRVLDVQQEPSTFWRDAKWSLEFRSYHFDRHNGAGDEREASVLGGQFRFESGSWRNTSVGFAWYNSTEISAQGGDTGLLGPGQDNLNVLGEAYLKHRFQGLGTYGLDLTLGRQRMQLPYVNENDARQVPATHEGITLSHTGGGFDYIVGHLAGFKGFADDEFQDLAEVAGAEGANEGVSLFGFRQSLGDGVSIGAANYIGWNTFNTFYSETSYERDLPHSLDVKTSVQFTDQRSIGDELTGEFDTYHISAKTAFGWQGAILTLGTSLTSKSGHLRKPWGGSPSFLSVQRFDFDRAGEHAYLFGLSYNPAFLSRLGWSSYLIVVHGTRAEDPVSNAKLPNRTEYDFTIDYKPPSGALEGLWLRLRYNTIDIAGDSADVHDFRVIVNYSIPIGR